MNHTEHQFSRRRLIVGGAALSMAAVGATPEARLNAATPQVPKLRYCLNTSTIRGQKLSVPQQIEVAAKAGYDGIEPWLGDLHNYLESGGSAADLRKRIQDAGLTVESAIGFARWIVDDAAERAKGLEVARRDMALVAEIGGTRIAAPPTGATKTPGLNLDAAALRYRALLEVGREEGVTPQLELWGFSQNLKRLGELMYVAVESGHPDACVLPDVYHIYKGGSDFAGLELIAGAKIHVFHMNDYPADPPRETIGDADRVYPGEGVAPIGKILRTIVANGYHGALSLELFNRE